MEKRSYSVEWLSESSHRSTTTTPLSNVDLLRCRLGQTLPCGKEHNIPLPSGMEKPNAETDFSDKENHVDNKTALYQAPSTLQDTHGASISRKTFQEVSAQRSSLVQEKCQLSDSMKSPGSVSEEESTSRPRTKFTAEQLQELEKSFKEHRYIGSSEKKRLSKVLKLSETQIKTWFQNRRMKVKRQSQDARFEAFFSGLYLPYYNYSHFQPPSCSVRPDLTVPLNPPAPVHPCGALPTAIVRPIHVALITPASVGSYPCPSVLVHPMIPEPMTHRYTP